MEQNSTPSSKGIYGQPKDSIEQVNKYGTYNIQPTNDSDNEFPAISQGLAKKLKDKEVPREEVRKIFHGKS
ncbi:MAG: hypothetical protein IKV36_00375 [Clostridia bacterium]|nr:hypothetical protein [Clostridia bacterium]